MTVTGKESFDDIFDKINHELAIGAREPEHPFHFANFASIGAEFPEVRTVVIRKLESDLSLYFFTDFRSGKISELQHNSAVSLHFYHPSERLQIRIKGKALIHHQNKVSKDFWKEIKGSAKKAYCSKLSPGQEIQQPEEAFDWDEEWEDMYFTAVQLVAKEVEVLQLNGAEHFRVNLRKSTEAWEGKWLVP